EALLGRNHDGEANRQVQTQISNDTEELLLPDSRPQILAGVSVIQLPADYQEVVQRLRQKAPLHEISERAVKLAIRKTSTGPVEVRQLTPLSVELLDLCADGLTVQEMKGEFLLRGIEIAGVSPDKLCLAGIEILRQQHLIAIS